MDQSHLRQKGNYAKEALRIGPASKLQHLFSLANVREFLWLQTTWLTFLAGIFC
jgi:hypothetical protein